MKVDYPFNSCNLKVLTETLSNILTLPYGGRRLPWVTSLSWLSVCLNGAAPNFSLPTDLVIHLHLKVSSSNLDVKCIFFLLDDTTHISAILSVYIELESFFSIKQVSFYCYRYNMFMGCPKAKTCTIIMRGGAEQFIEETERSLHDAIMIVRRAIKNDSVVAGRCCAYLGMLSSKQFQTVYSIIKAYMLSLTSRICFYGIPVIF